MGKKSKYKKSTSGRVKWRSTAVLESVAAEFEEWNDVAKKYTGLTSFLSESGRLRLAELKRAESNPTGLGPTNEVTTSA